MALLIIFNRMINKNVANYTDFMGKTNKKIVQAPGGSSSLSLAWGNEKVDYGPPRTFKNLQKYNDPPASSQMPSYSGFFEKNNSHYVVDIKTPIKLMSNIEEYVPDKFHIKKNTVSKNEDFINRRIGGQYGYNQRSSYNRSGVVQTPNISGSFHEKQQIDMAVQQQNTKKLHTAPKLGQRPTRGSSEIITKNAINEPRSCIKIIQAPKQLLVLGDQSYNFWKEDQKARQLLQSGKNNQIPKRRLDRKRGV